jgi:hypothetical protein
MTAEEHNNTLATLYLVYAGIHGLTLIALLMLVFAVQSAFAGGSLLSPFWMTIGAMVFLVLLLVVGILPLLVGVGFKKRARWLKPVAYPLAIISMVNIPIGTALGVYTIKFFRSEGGARIYGGKASAANDADLSDALSGTRPLMNWADRFK